MITPVLYWDSSAILSCLVADVHSEQAKKQLVHSGLHLVSSLGQAEVLAVLRRIEKTNPSFKTPIKQAREMFLGDCWAWTTVQPKVQDIESLSKQYTLRGADLWHAAAFLELRRTVLPLTMVTFDRELQQVVESC